MVDEKNDGWGDEGDTGDELGELKAKKKSGPSANLTALRILDDHRFVEDAGGTIYRYHEERGHWSECSFPTMLSIVHHAVPWATAAYRVNVVKTIAAQTHKADLKWSRVGVNEVAVKNGVIDLDSMELRPHDPDDWLDYAIPHVWDASAKCPTWDQAVEDWIGGDSEAAQALQDFFGYLIMPHAHYKMGLVFQGPSDSGKTRPPMAMKTLVGEAATCSIGIEHMDDPVKMSVIKHRRLNMLTELSSDAMIKDGGFKTLVSTEEPIFLNPKNKPPEMYTPVAKHVIACNSLPMVNDRTKATFNRLLILHFHNVVAKADQDPDLDDKINAEVAGLLAWAVVGAERLYKAKGRFTEVAESEAAKLAMARDANPMNDFLDGEMVAEAGCNTPLLDIVKRFNKGDFGRRTDSRAVGRNLRSALADEAATGGARPGPGQPAVKCLKGWRFRREDDGFYPDRSYEPPVAPGPPEGDPMA